MEDQIKQELKSLCEAILSASSPSNFEEQLQNTRALYEKLLVLNYVATQQPTSTKPTDKEVVAEPKPTLNVTKPFAQPEAQAPKKETPEPEAKQPEPEAIEFIPAPKKEEKTAPPPIKVVEKKEAEPISQKSSKQNSGKQNSINERYGMGTISLGLNDRIAFQNQLFDGSQEDLNRVLSQINTYTTYSEAQNFVVNMVKPDYNWTDKEETESRFLELVKARFGE